MSTYLVSNSTALLATLKNAKSGDVIQLAGGTYAAIQIQNLHTGGNVTITSQSGSNPAVLTRLSVWNSSGLTFSGLDLSTAGSSYAAPFGVFYSSNITLSGLKVFGAAANVQETGLSVENSSNIVITGSTFSNLMNAVSDLNNNNIQITNNKVSYIGGDGFDNGGSSNVLISGNTFTNFEPAGTQHSDAIQFWTSNTVTSASNITITNNTITQGASNVYQGIFITDQVGNLPYQNLTISNNTIYGGLWNGLEVGHANNVSITGNKLVSWGDGSSNLSPVSRIVLLNTSMANVSNNTAAQFVYTGDSALNQTGNATNTYANGTTGNLSATAPIETVAQHGTVAGKVTITDTAGVGAFISSVNSDPISFLGTTINGQHGQLTVHQNGTFSYDASGQGLVVGQVYYETFKATVHDALGHSSSVYLQFQITGSATGTPGADSIVAGSGAQTIAGLGGADTLVSGSGPDTFVYTSLFDSLPAAHDTIVGFKAGDVIDLSAVDPSFQIVSAFDHHAHELVLQNEGNGSWDIYGDTTGSGVANFQIHLTGATTSLTASSFHL